MESAVSSSLWDVWEAPRNEDTGFRSLKERWRMLLCAKMLPAMAGRELLELELFGGSGKLKDVLRLGMMMGSSSEEEEYSSSEIVSGAGPATDPPHELRCKPC